MGFNICRLLIFVNYLVGRYVNSALTSCAASEQADCSSAQDGVCDSSYDPDSCLCNLLYTQTGSDSSATCTLKDCTTPATDCGANTACTFAGKCACLVTHITWILSGSSVCARKSCSNNNDCTGRWTSFANSYCLTNGSDLGCHCTATYSASDTTCAQTTCTQDSIVSTTCGSSNTVCGLTQNSYKCSCAVNYIVNGGSCTQTACTTSNVATHCGATHVCTDSKCECSSDYVASGTMCKRNCSANANVCHANADCVDELCECGVNYFGNGATCTALTCSGTDATTCHPNSQCSGSPAACSCATGWKANGTVCAKICTRNSDCGSGSTAGSCNTAAGNCQCKATYVGDGVVCNQKRCSGNSDCMGIAHSTCNTTSGLCFCTDGVDSRNMFLCSGGSNPVVNPALTLCGANRQSDCINVHDGVCDSSYTPDVCLCNNLYNQTGSDASATCVLKNCKNPTSDCGSNTICTNDAKCSCLATHEIAVSRSTTVCKRKGLTCTKTVDCTGASVRLANSYCVTSGSDQGCHCTATYSASATGCASKTCTKASIVEATCGSSNTVCEHTQNAYKCECAANYEASGDSCTQKGCTTANVATDCGATHVCTDSKCECSPDYVASGTMCKRNCSANATVCHTNADCIDGICECRVNYQGNGAACTALTCSGTDATTCHPNSHCSNGTCTCASGWKAYKATCSKPCTENSDCGSGATAGSCNTTAGVCQCTVTYVGDGVVCNQKKCAANSDCGVIANATCNTTSGLCVCIGRVDPNNPFLCTSGTTFVVYNFSFMLLSFMISIFFRKL